MKSIMCLLFALYSYGVPYTSLTMREISFPVLSNLQAAGKDTAITMAKNKKLFFAKEVDMDIIASDGAKLKATYYASDKPGPGVLLLHQCNMDRRSWKTLATTLAQRGIHVLTFDYRGYGETAAIGDNEKLATDIDAALTMLISQPGVDKFNIGAGGASCGVNNTVQLAKRNGKIKALMLLSGPASEEGLVYLRKHPDLAIFGAASSEEDFAVKAIREMVATSTNPASAMKELHNAGHGAPMFTADPMLLQLVANWMVKVLR